MSTSAAADCMFTPYQLGSLTLKNRFIKAATFEGRSPHGFITDALIEWHQNIARGGVAMTTMAYGAVNENGKSFGDQVHIHAGIQQDLRRFTDVMHAAGAAAALQLTHCGYFTKNKRVARRRPLGPSFVVNHYGLFSGLPIGHPMKVEDIDDVVEDFGKAAYTARESGFDAVEVHAGHGYLLSQFLSPGTNRRKDQYGGSIENRARFTRRVIRSIRQKTGNDFPILVKMNLSDGIKRGTNIEDAVALSKMMENEGVHGLVLSAGFTSKSPFYLLRGDRPLREMIASEPNAMQRLGMKFLGPMIIREYPFSEMFLLDQAKMIRSQVKLPLVVLGGMISRENFEVAMSEGFELIALGRPLIHDPNFINKIKTGEVDRSGCIPCNKCIPAMDQGGIRCVLKEEGMIS